MAYFVVEQERSLKEKRDGDESIDVDWPLALSYIPNLLEIFNRIYALPGCSSTEAHG